MSDTHGMHHRVAMPAWVDVMLHAGDLSITGETSVIRDFFEWYNQLPYTYKIFIAGNHDLTFQEEPGLIRDMLKQYPNIIYLEDNTVEVGGLKIYGSPYTVWYGNWAFMEADHMLGARWQNIPDDVDILITHGPAYGVLDKAMRGNLCGSQTLMSRIIALERNKLKLHLCGHIHEAYGYKKTDECNKTLFINASCVNYEFEPVNPVQVIHI